MHSPRDIYIMQGQAHLHPPTFQNESEQAAQLCRLLSAPPSLRGRGRGPGRPYLLAATLFFAAFLAAGRRALAFFAAGRAAFFAAGFAPFVRSLRYFSATCAAASRAIG